MPLDAATTAKISNQLRMEQVKNPPAPSRSSYQPGPSGDKQYNMALQRFKDTSSKMAATPAVVLNQLKTPPQDQPRSNIYSPMPPAIQQTVNNQVEKDNDLMTSGNFLSQSVNGNQAGFHDQSQLGLRNYTRAFLPNDKVDLQKGITELQLPGERQALNIPNALVQMLDSEQGYNKGRSNVINDYFGQEGNGKYTSRTVVQDYLNTLSNSPVLQGSGSINQNDAQAARSRSLNSQKQQLLAQNGGVATENRGVGGNVNGGTLGRINDIDNQIGAGRPDPNTFQNNFEADQTTMHLGAALRRLRSMKATSSNLPIEERIVR